ncbi:MAG: ComEC family competence protein [Bacteroidales bacterium]|nr:ComEC family competence protein [Bacteroidales bacterium]
MKIENYPVVKLLFPYVIGILIAYNADFGEQIRPLLLTLTGASFLMTFSLTFVKSYRWRIVKTPTMVLAFVLTGILLTNIRLHPTLPTELMMTNTDWGVRVAEEPTLCQKSVKIPVEVLHVNNKQDVKAKVLFYLKPSADAKGLHYGDLLFVHAKLSRIPPPYNPDAFDNQRYMQRRGIYYTSFVNENAWERIGNRPENRVKYLAQKTRNRLTSTYISAGMSGEELDILKAILLGDDDTLDPELKASYSAAGVSHILCVSGMHVGVIFMIINFLLKPLDLFRRSRFLKTVLVMLVIWLYAHITGLAPSVTRSATMFTFVAIGQLLRRNTNVFHSLFASMFILLIIHPLLLFEVGFQLSYLAVVGIVLFQPKLSALYTCRTRIGNYFWELVTVSAAAQIGTFPISIYYFAKFPNYFLLSNLSVITLSFVVIITGISLLPLSLIPFIAQHASWILTKEISVMNCIIRFIEQLPYSVTENIDYHIIQVILLYAVIGCVCLLLYRRSRKTFWIACTLFTLFYTSFAMRKVQLAGEKGFIAFHIRKISAMGFQSQGSMVLFSDSIHNEKNDLYRYNISNYARKHHLKVVVVPIDTSDFDTAFLCKRGNFIRFNGKNYFILNKKQKNMVRNKNDGLSVDCLLLRQNPKIAPDEIMLKLPFREVVADGSNSAYYVEKWRSFCAEKGIPFHYTGEEK